MKKLLLIILLGFFSNLFGQKIDLQWEQPSTINLPEGDFLTLKVKGAEYNAENYYLPKITKTFFGLKIKEIKIIHSSYEACNVFESKLIDPRFQNDQVKLDISSFISGNEYVNQISFTPIRINKTLGLAEKLTSIEYQVVFENQFTASNLKTKNTKITGNSVLSSGNWYKYQLSSSGIYKLTYSQLKSNGVDVDNLNPSSLKIYHNGGGMLPEPNSAFKFDDLNEIPIVVFGEQDNSFDQGDYILFYGESTHKTNYNASKKLFQHTFNIYDNQAYYFITYGGASGKRIIDKNLPSSADITVNEFNEFKFIETDLENVLISGREWYGDAYTFINPRTYSFSAPGIVNSSDITITSSLMGMIPGASGFFNSKINGKTLGQQTIFGATSSNYGIKGRENKTDFTVNSSSVSNPSNINLEIEWDNSNNSTGIGYTNFLEINYKRKLNYLGSQLIFSSIESLDHANTKYQLSSSNSSLVLWDIENSLEPKNINYVLSNSTLSFIDSSNVLMKYIAAGTNNFLTPTFSEKIENQNLHSTSGNYDLLIITPQSLINEAQSYGDFKTSIGTSNEVILLDELYNEFSCGAQDVVGIRNFIKYVYDKGGMKLKYVLLFGDASYDYKNINGKNEAMIPVYESYQSLHNISTFSSDDFYGFLDDNEGNWTENNANDHFLNIGVGRFPVKNPEEAQIVIDKFIKYSLDESSLGKWRNNISFVADDGDNALHMRQADDLSEFVLQADSSYNIKKLFLDAYEQITTPGGQNSPGFNNAFDNSLREGNLIVNYTGHGSERQWAIEELITQAKIRDLKNEYRLPLYVTATCEFGRYDNPEEESGAENLLLIPEGGAISLVTTTRPVFSSSNFNLNTAFYNFVLTPKNDSTMRTLGEIMIGTKNNSLNGVFNRNFSLLGDPSLTLSYPKNNIAITKMNGVAIGPSQDTIRALETVSLEGEIQYHSNNLINSFSGKLFITIYDKESEVKTLGDEKDSSGDPIIIDYLEQKSILFDGIATIKDGKFKVNFVVPKDISYNFGSGKISMYASKEASLEDANGYLNDFIIGGSSANVQIDDTPPEIELFMDDESFINGSIVGSNSLFIAKIQDDNGINTAGTGIGHEITAILDGDDKNPIILNSYYTSTLDSYQEGMVRYFFEGLSDGMHTITFKVWDTHNNSSTAKIRFEVANELNAYNYPNPFNDFTTFVVDQSRSGDSGVLDIHIINTRGREEVVLSKTFKESSKTTELITWDGTNSKGINLAPGIYFYRVLLRYDSDGTTVSKLDRLVKVE